MSRRGANANLDEPTPACLPAAAKDARLSALTAYEGGACDKLYVLLSGAVDDSPPPAIETLDDREGVQRSNSYSNSGSPVAKHALTLQHSLSETALLEVASPGDIRPCDRHRHE